MIFEFQHQQVQYVYYVIRCLAGPLVLLMGNKWAHTRLLIPNFILLYLFNHCHDSWNVPFHLRLHYNSQKLYHECIMNCAQLQEYLRSSHGSGHSDMFVPFANVAAFPGPSSNDAGYSPQSQYDT